MKAAVLEGFGGPEGFVVRDVQDPVPRPGRVIVRLHAAALNWHDVLVRRGRYGSSLPHVAGADGAGVRTDTGAEVVILPSLFWGAREEAPGEEFQILGDTTPGTYAELVSVPEECLAPKPAGFDWAQAAALPLAGVTSYRALFSRARLAPGESLLIIGAGGGIATTALGLAAGAGARVTVTASTDAKLGHALSAGASGGVLHTDPDWPARARELSPGGTGFDVVLDPVGLWDRSVRALRPGGRIVVLGANVAEQVSMDVRAFFFGQYSLLGTTMGSPADFRGLLDLVGRGAVPPPVIGATYPLDDIAAAHRRLEAGDAVGKIVVIP